MRAKYGIDARQYADFATLRGDASDGLPGVPGVGEKTAATLLGRFGDMDGIIAAAADPDSDMGPDRAARSRPPPTTSTSRRQVVAVARDIDLGSPGTALPSEPRDLQRLAELGHEVGPGEPGAAADRRAGLR